MFANAILHSILHTAVIIADIWHCDIFANICRIAKCCLPYDDVIVTVKCLKEDFQFL